MVSYEFPDATSTKLIKKVFEDHHKPLLDAKLKIDAQFWVGEEGACGIKEGGYDAFGKVIVFTADKRKAGSPDMRVCLDAAAWKDSSADQRRAIVDTLLERIEVRTDKDGEIIRDSAGRPKLKRRKFDLRMTGFKSVVERHSADSVEARVFAGIQPTFKQMKLPLTEALSMAAPPPPPEPESKDEDEDDDTADD